MVFKAKTQESIHLCFLCYFNNNVKLIEYVGQEFGCRANWVQRKRRIMAAAKLKFPGISDELSEILDANMDEAPARRRAREAFKDIQLNIDHILLKVVLFFAFFFMLFAYLHSFFFLKFDLFIYLFLYCFVIGS